MSLSYDAFVARLDALRSHPDRQAALAGLRGLEQELGTDRLAPVARLLFSARYADVGAMPDARRHAEALAGQAARMEEAAPAAMKAVANLFASHGTCDERLLESVLPLAARSLRRTPGDSAAAMLVLAASFTADRWRVFTRVRRRFVAALDPAALAADPLARFVAMCRPDAERFAADRNPPMDGVVPVKGARPDGPAVLIACDEVYWQRFGAIALAALRRVEPRRPLHAHVVDVGEATLRQLADMAQADPAFGYSCMRLDPTLPWAADPSRRKTFYSCARFVMLEPLLRTLGVPLLLLDVDAVVRRPLGPVFAAYEGGPPAVTRHFGLNPWYDFGAGFCHVAPDAEGLRFARSLRRYIMDAFQDGHGFWHLDQIALWFVDRYWRSGGSGLRPESYLISRRHVHFAGQFQGALSLDDKQRQMAALGGLAGGR